MKIDEAIVQGLEKSAGVTAVKENFQDALTPVNKYLETLAKDLHDSYNRASNNYGRFDEDEKTYPFAAELRGYLDGTMNLVQLSHATGRLIKARMEQSPPATGGYVCFLRYTSKGRDWLLVAMLKLSANITIDEKSLALKESMVFDMRHLHEAARVDLDRWREDDVPYLSFIKRTGRSGEVTRYFRLALGCTDYADARANTKAAIDALNGYLDAQEEWTAEEKQAARKRAYEFFQEKEAAGEPVHRDTLSARINEQAPEDFAEYIAKHDFPVNETFSPHARSFRGLRRIDRRFGNMRLAFDVDDVIAQRITYNESERKVTIHDAPGELIEAMQRAAGHGNDSEEQT